MSRALAIEAAHLHQVEDRAHPRGQRGEVPQKAGSGRILGWIDRDIYQIAPKGTRRFEKGLLVGSVFKASKNSRTALYMNGGLSIMQISSRLGSFVGTIQGDGLLWQSRRIRREW